jgi:hypothetical protein
MQVTNGSALLALGSPRSVAAGNLVKLAAMVVFIPLGFRYDGLRGGIVGIILSDALKYLASSWLASRKGLHMFGKDLMLSVLVAATAAGCLAVADTAVHLAHTPRAGALLALGVVGVLSGAAWGPLVLWSMRSRKAVA